MTAARQEKAAFTLRELLVVRAIISAERLSVSKQGLTPASARYRQMPDEINNLSPASLKTPSFYH